MKRVAPKKVKSLGWQVPQQMAPQYAPSLRSRLPPLLLFLQLGFIVIYAFYIEIDGTLGGITFNTLYPGECWGSGRNSWNRQLKSGYFCYVCEYSYNLSVMLHLRYFFELRALGRGCSYSWWTLISSTGKKKRRGACVHFKLMSVALCVSLWCVE